MNFLMSFMSFMELVKCFFRDSGTTMCLLKQSGLLHTVSSPLTVQFGFTTTGMGHKEARRILYKHQNSVVHKQAALLQLDYHTDTPLSLQLDRVAVDDRSRLKEKQEKNREILYHIMSIIVTLVKSGHHHPLCSHREDKDS